MLLLLVVVSRTPLSASAPTPCTWPCMQENAWCGSCAGAAGVCTPSDGISSGVQYCGSGLVCQRSDAWNMKCLPGDGPAPTDAPTDGPTDAPTDGPTLVPTEPSPTEPAPPGSCPPCEVNAAGSTSCAPCHIAKAWKSYAGGKYAADCVNSLSIALGEGAVPGQPLKYVVSRSRLAWFISRRG